MRVRLLQMHTHEGHDREPGEIIDLEPELAEWLIDSGVAEPLDADKETYRTGGNDK
jgi:hypothetical protein